MKSKHFVFNLHDGVEQRLSRVYSDDEVITAMEKVGFLAPSKLNIFNATLPNSPLNFDENIELEREIKRQVIFKD